MKSRIVILLVIISIFFLVGCIDSEIIDDRDMLIIYSPHPLEFIDPIIVEFENDTGIAVEVIVAGTGELLARIESEIDGDGGDVLWGGSLSTLESGNDLFKEYKSINEDHAIYKNEDGYITRFTMMPSVIMINTNLIGDIQVDGYLDLLNPKLKGKIAYADPAKSSSSFEQLLNQLCAMGEGNIEKGWEYVEKLILNMDNKLLLGSSAVYNGVAQGEYTIGLIFEEAAANFVENGAPVKIVYPVEGTILRPDGIAIIKNSKNVENAEKFIDFVTSKEIQTFIVTELNRRSIRDDVPAAKGLIAYENIFIIEDNQKWSSANKGEIIDRYKKLFKELNE